ncbi:MAG: hypothetical protein F4114_09850 [Rhodospirillaceae bacterium]|nr:hypothetical protein [Rhodospirillaceae bacterium]MYB12982.1 hypothetical protein [Rhodospirillaceae bacterium]MYI49375.1 hypothetical protein [Rhodospirillaceae bacterium]
MTAARPCWPAGAPRWTGCAAGRRAAEIITAARTGRDPAAAGGRGGRGPTVAELAQRFLEEYVPAHCKPGTRTVYRRAFVNHVIPWLGARRVADVERADIVALHHALRATLYQANRTVQICRASSPSPRSGACARTAPTRAGTSGGSARRSASASCPTRNTRASARP